MSSKWILDGVDGSEPTPTSEPDTKLLLEAIHRNAVLLIKYFQPDGMPGLLVFDRAMIESIGVAPDHLLAIHVPDDSMEPTLKPGTVVFVDVASKELHDGLWALRLDRIDLVRRVQMLPARGVRIVSDNQAYAPLDIRGADLDAMSVIGRVVWAGGKL